MIYCRFCQYVHLINWIPYKWKVTKVYQPLNGELIGLWCTSSMWLISLSFLIKISWKCPRDIIDPHKGHCVYNGFNSNDAFSTHTGNCSFYQKISHFCLSKKCSHFFSREESISVTFIKKFLISVWVRSDLIFFPERNQSLLNDQQGPVYACGYIYHTLCLALIN